ncbi:aMP-forming long-chain acyl-CoA synthetase [Clostridium sp. CAG:245]|jgi:hypothetical protein|nr:aMP-forming long-chain acyl-CoA synthetase [Clostridium sp. CAG:245]
MRKINTVKELVDFAYNRYKTKKAITIESDYIKNINYFNFRFDIYSMARVIKSKENQIRNNKIAIISEFRYEFLVTYLANIMVNNAVILIDNKLSKNAMEKVIKKYNINTIFFSSTYKEKILEIIKNNNCNNFNLINFDSENQFPIIEYEKLINIGRYIENYSIDNLSKEENREKSTIIVSLAGEKKYSQQEFIESANVIAKTARIRKRKEMNALEQVNTFYEVVIGIILPMICGLNTKYFADNELIKNDLLIIEENNKNMVILYRKHKYLVEHTGINTYVARAEENLPAREHKKDTQNFVLIKTDKKDRIKNNKSQATV